MIYETRYDSLKRKKMQKKQAAKIMIFVLVVIISALWLFPFFLMINNSLKSNYDMALTSDNPTQIVKNVSSQAYNTAISAMDFWKTLLISLLVTIISNILIIFFSSLAAWQLSRSKKWYSKVIFYIFLIAMIIPFQAIMIPLLNIVSRTNLANIPGLILLYTGFGMAMSIFMMHGFLKGIPSALEEAAKVEGLNPIKIYFKIILPILKPIIVTVIIINTMWIWNDFLLPKLIHDQNPDGQTTLPVKLSVTLIGKFSTNLNGLMAGITMIVIPALVFFVILQRQIVAGITRGAIK